MEKGATPGHYKIVRSIGPGGIGEVYQATDTRLHGPAAISILPAAYADDSERPLRFEPEAKATAALNHPNDIGSHDFSNTYTEPSTWMPWHDLEPKFDNFRSEPGIQSLGP